MTCFARPWCFGASTPLWRHGPSLPPASTCATATAGSRCTSRHAFTSVRVRPTTAIPLCVQNNLWTSAERPPDVLVNVVVDDASGVMPSIVGEVQLHLREVLLLKKSVLHCLYQIVRANSIDTLLAETKKPRRKSIVTTVRPRDEAGDDNHDQAREAAEEVELAPIAPLVVEQSSSCLLTCGAHSDGCISAEV